MDKDWVQDARTTVQRYIYDLAHEHGHASKWSRTVIYLLFMEEASFALRGQAQDPEFAEQEDNVKEALNSLLADITDSSKARAIQRYWNMDGSGNPVADAAKVLGTAILYEHRPEERAQQFLVALSELIAFVGYEEIDMADIAKAMDFISRQLAGHRLK